jgi:hypothetical protein
MITQNALFIANSGRQLEVFGSEISNMRFQISNKIVEVFEFEISDFKQNR